MKMNISQNSLKTAQMAAQTVKNPTNIPTGDVVSDLIKRLLAENDKISKEEVIELLQSQGFPNATKIEEFIETQIEVMSK